MLPLCNSAGTFVKYEDIIRPSGSRSFASMFKDLFSANDRPLEERRLSLRTFLPKWDVNCNTSVFEQVEAVADVCKHFENAAYAGVDDRRPMSVFNWRIPGFSLAPVSCLVFIDLLLLLCFWGCMYMY